MKNTDGTAEDGLRRFGLIGYPLSHSFSPVYFAEKFRKEGIVDASYELYPLRQICNLETDLPSDVRGINVTIPYKEVILPFLDSLSKEAEMIGAVNTIDFRNGRKVGYNTDVYGFETSLLRICEGSLPGKALILGTGGAAKAVRFVLDKHAVSYLVISRSKGDLTYDQLNKDLVRQHQLIINTTPLGMYPDVNRCPNIGYKYLTEDHILYDLVYNPGKTLFLEKGFSKGARIKNGLEMLELQAEKSWEIWNK